LEKLEMKKTLVALAAVSAASAFAQSTVTLSGNLDFAGARVTGSAAVSNGTTFSTTVGTSSTSVINLDAVEDLGAGLVVKAHYGLDPRSLSNDAMSLTLQGNGNSASTATTAQTPGTVGQATSNTLTGLNRDEVYVGLASTSTGEIRLGSPNAIGLNVFQAASPLGTGVGSGYAPNTGKGMNSVVQTRYNRSVRYDSPAISGVTVSLLYAPGNDIAADTTLSSASQYNASFIPNSRKATEFGLKYANGPLNLAVVSVTQGTANYPTGYYANAVAVPASAATSATVFAVNYNFGSTTVYAGYNTGNTLVGNAADGSTINSKGYRYAVKQTVGQVDLIAQYQYQQQAGNTSAANDVKNQVTGARADYNFSKTAAAYFGYEKWNTGLAASDASTSKGDRTIVSIGLKKQF
jgi:predicted porin